MLTESANAILYGPGYFYCEKAHCRMSIKACLKRQGTAVAPFEEDPFMICRGCSQGREIKKWQVLGTGAGIEMEKVEEKELCKDCGLNPPIRPKYPYCPACMSKKAKEKRTRETQNPQKPKKGTLSKAEPKKPETGPIRALQIDFGKYAFLLERIEALAEDQVRTVEEQIIFLLKEGTSKSPIVSEGV